jgi:N-acyl-D-amino-acid deacylase
MTSVVRGGTILDGTGAEAFTGDLAIDGAAIAQVGGKAGPGKREIDANGLLVTRGWVDVHTHYDGQATWDPVLAPSSWHGVTTILFGNCGIGFAPVRREHRAGLIDLMEAIEDIQAQRSPKACNGIGKASPNASTHSTACRARSTSARRSRITRCGCS